MRRNEPAQPVGGLSVFMNRKYTLEYMRLTSSEDKTECITSFISFLKPAIYTLDITLFDVFHRKIVEYLMKLSRKGVRIRLLAFSTVQSGPRNMLVNKYIQTLREAHVEIRFLNQDVEAMYRLVLVNATDPARRPFDYEVGAVIGENTENGDTLIANMRGLSIVYSDSVVVPWRERFLRLWGNVHVSA